MSKLEELIQQLCPEGVAYKKLGDIATIARGGSFQKKDFCDSGVPCIHYGQIYTRYGMFASETFTFIPNEIAPKQKYAQPGDIVMAVTSENIEDVCKCIAWLGDEDAAISGHTAIIHHTQNAKYLSYYFHSGHFQKQKLKYIHGTKVMEVTPAKLVDITIPVPPLPVQAEIVRILDNFTELTEELTEELIARKKQYRFFRDEVFNNIMPIKVCKIKDVVTFYNGRAYKREELLDTGKYKVIRVGNFYTNDKIYYSDLELDAAKYCYPGDLVYTWAATIGPHIYQGEKAIFHYHIWKVDFNEELLNKKYLYYFLMKDVDDIFSSLTNSTMPHVSMSSMNERDIPIPSLAEQERIVTILDHFDTLCNDISNGLPAEIEARQKQYKYYQDKLLKFPERKVTP